MSTTKLDALYKAIRGGNARYAAALVPRLADEERQRVAKELPALLAELREADSTWAWSATPVKSALRVTGAGCLSGPAAAARWLSRADLRLVTRFGFNGDRGPAELVVKATEGRPAEWRAEVGRRLAGLLRTTAESDWNGEETAWWTCALLLRSAGAPVPVEDAFAVGWVRWTDGRGVASGDPLAEAMMPRIFEVEAIGRLITSRGETEAWIEAVLTLAEEKRLERATVLDGCLRRFLRGGTVADLRWYAELHDRLAPDLGEATARLRDYLRLLPAAPSRVAELALREVRRVDAAGGLGPAAYSEAAEALLFRPEQKLVRAALAWLAQSADRADQKDATLCALAVAFAHEAHAVQERATDLAVKFGPGAGREAVLRVREAATALPHDLRERIAAAFGEVEAPAAAPAGALPAPPPPSAFPGPFGSAAELAEEFAVVLRQEPSWTDSERISAGITELAHRDVKSLRAALKGFFEGDRGAWYRASDYDRFMYSPRAWPVLAARSVLRARWRPKAGGELRLERRGAEPHDAPMSDFLIGRMREVAERVERVPLLLATPTRANGHLDPEVLVARVERLEAAGVEPGPHDLVQALLRLPRDAAAGSGVTARAERLESPAGQAVAAWLREGGVADPFVERVEVRLPEVPFRPAVALMGVLRPVGDVPKALAPLWDYPLDGAKWRESPETFALAGYSSPPAWWPAIAPSHAEVAAAHLLPQLLSTLDFPHDQGAALLGLAECDGPTGVATGAALAYGLTVEPLQERTCAVDAFLLMAARGRLPAAEVGAAAGALAAHREAKLGRVVGGLGDAAAAGAHAEVWRAVEAALPAVLTAHASKPVPGMADLLALGVRTAETSGARGPAPEGLAAAAGRGGSSRTVKEAVRLRDLLARN
ncbi:DUF6493 family protein [Actinomadura rugatobispora]|uniref:DUF6493 family protein n=1 Tax=Actinomadura rugatobispora TaxID=1994 RepID=A0ABW0ZVN6_9ACTN|nr:hypothetical protein GCM10010200_009520 [Actinomadura rugatobispora]